MVAAIVHPAINSISCFGISFDCKKNGRMEPIYHVRQVQSQNLKLATRLNTIGHNVHLGVTFTFEFMKLDQNKTKY